MPKLDPKTYNSKLGYPVMLGRGQHYREQMQSELSTICSTREILSRFREILSECFPNGLTIAFYDSDGENLPYGAESPTASANRITITLQSLQDDDLLAAKVLQQIARAQGMNTTGIMTEQQQFFWDAVQNSRSTITQQEAAQRLTEIITLVRDCTIVGQTTVKFTGGYPRVREHDRQPCKEKKAVMVDLAALQAQQLEQGNTFNVVLMPANEEQPDLIDTNIRRRAYARLSLRYPSADALKSTARFLEVISKAPFVAGQSTATVTTTVAEQRVLKYDRLAYQATVGRDMFMTLSGALPLAKKAANKVVGKKKPVFRFMNYGLGAFLDQITTIRPAIAQDLAAGVLNSLHTLCDMADRGDKNATEILHTYKKFQLQWYDAHLHHDAAIPPQQMTEINARLARHGASFEFTAARINECEKDEYLIACGCQDSLAPWGNEGLVSEESSAPGYFDASWDAACKGDDANFGLTMNPTTNPKIRFSLIDTNPFMHSLLHRLGADSEHLEMNTPSADAPSTSSSAATTTTKDRAAQTSADASTSAMPETAKEERKGRAIFSIFARKKQPAVPPSASAPNLMSYRERSKTAADTTEAGSAITAAAAAPTATTTGIGFERFTSAAGVIASSTSLVLLKEPRKLPARSTAAGLASHRRATAASKAEAGVHQSGSMPTSTAQAATMAPQPK